MLDFGVCSVLSADATSALADCVVTILTPVVKSDTPSVTTTPPPNVQPQSPTTKQAQKEINPKYKDLSPYI
jgi:hypothetical protein